MTRRSPDWEEVRLGMVVQERKRFLDPDMIVVVRRRSRRRFVDPFEEG